MFEKKALDTSSSKALTVIAEGVTIDGKIFSNGSTRIDGKVTGEIVSEKDFVIGKEGVVEAKVNTTNAVIAGKFKGEMIAQGEVEITSTGKFEGKLIQKTALLSISKGGIFKGESIITEDEEIFKNLTIPDLEKPYNIKPSIEKINI